MRSGIKITKDITSQIKDAIQAMGNQRVLVGIPQQKAARKRGDSNAELGYIHEHGSPVRNIPARPFLVPGVKSAEEKILPVLKAGAQAVLDGDKIDAALNRAGLIAQAAVKKYIVAGTNFAPLSPLTLKARERVGFRGTKPLIQTAQLLNSITYVIRKRGEK